MGRLTKMSPAPKNIKKRKSNRSNRDDGDKRDRSRKTTKRPSSEEMTKSPVKVSRVVKPSPNRVTRATSNRGVKTKPWQNKESSSRKMNAVTRLEANQLKGGAVKPQAKNATIKQAKSKLKTSAKTQAKKLGRGGREGRETRANKANILKVTDHVKTKKVPVAKGSKRQWATMTKTKKTAVVKRIKQQREQKATTSKTKKTTVAKKIKLPRKSNSKTRKMTVVQRKKQKATTPKTKKTTVAKKIKQPSTFESKTKMTVVQRKKQKATTPKTMKTTFPKKISQPRTSVSKTKKLTVVRKQQKATVLKTKKTTVAKKRNQGKAITPKTKKTTFATKTNQKRSTVVKTKNIKTVSANGTKAKGSKMAKHPNSKLTPNPNIKEVAKDPMFEVRNEKEIPKVSDYVNCKRAIRAVLTKDSALLKKLITNTKEIPTLFVKRSASLQDDALDYAVKTGNIDALKMLIEEKYNQDDSRRKPMPRNLDLYNFKSSYSRDYKEGNGALTKDVDLDSETKIIVRFEKALTHGVSLEIIKLLNEGSGYDCTGTIFRAVRAGHCKLAGQMMRTFKGRRGNGFIKLHEEVLMATKPEQLTSFKADLVTKKSLKNQRITPLHCAAINPITKILAKMLSVFPDISLRDQAGFTPVHYAAACTTSGPLKLLLKSGASADEPQPKKLVTPLMIAAKYGRAKNVEVLLKKIKPNPSQPKTDKVGVDRKDRSGHYVIHYAAEGGYVDCVSTLVKHGAAVEAKESWKNHKITPLMIASERGHCQLAKVLIVELGAEIEKRDKFKRTSLMLACMNGHYPVATLLLRKGADPNAKDSSGNTPVHYAAAYGWWHCLKLLLQAGGNPNIFNDGKDHNTPLTPLGAAYIKGHIGCLELLLSHPDVDVNCRDSKGATLLLTACDKETTDESLRHVKLLVDSGADINATNGFGKTPFRCALKKGCISLLKMFLAVDRSVPLDADRSETNPLHWLAEKCMDVWPEILEILVNNEKMRGSKPTNPKGGGRSQKNTRAKVVTLQEAARMKDKKGCTPFLACIVTHSSWGCKGKESSICKEWHATLKALIDLCKSDINALVENDQENLPRDSCALHILASKEPSDALSMIVGLKSAKLDVVNAKGYTPLLCAIDAKQTQNVKTLLAAGADPNGTDKHNALLLAVKQNLPDIIPDLIAKGVDVRGSVFDNKQPSIMHYLTVYMYIQSESQLSIAKELLASGAPLNAVDDDNRTVLHTAVNMGTSTAFLKFLLDHNLDASAVDITKRWPLHYAFVKYKPFTRDVIDSKSRSSDPIGDVELLVAAMDGINLNANDTSSTTPLHYAASVGAIYSVKCISERICDLNIQDRHGYTPLSMAVIYSKQSVAKWLIEKGASLNLPLVFDYTMKNQAGAGGEVRTSIFREVVHEDWRDVVSMVMDKISKAEITWMSYLDALEVLLSEERFQMADRLIHQLPEPYTLQSTNEKCQNLLHLLAIHVEVGGDIQDKIVIFLLDNGVKLFETDQTGCTPLHYAAVNNNISFCNIFASKDPIGFESCITCADHRGRVPVTSLFWSLLYNRNVKEVIELIRKHKGSLDVCTAFPNVSLMSMKQQTRSESLQEWYHNLPDEKTTDVTPLIFMVLINNFAGCRLLLQNGAKPNERDRNGMTPLMHAVRQSEIALVLLLMDLTFEPEKAGMKMIEEEKTPWIAEPEDKLLPWTTGPWKRSKSGSTKNINILDGYEKDGKQDVPKVPTYSLTSSLDMDAVDSLGRTAVHHLMKTCDYGTYENVEMLELLAQVGAKLTEQDHRGKTPLDYSVEAGSQKMAAALMKLTGVDAPNFPLNPAPVLSDGVAFPSPKPDFDHDAKAMIGVLQAERSKTRQAEDLRCQEEQPVFEEQFSTDVFMDKEQSIQYQATMTKVEVHGNLSSHFFYDMQLIELSNGAVHLRCHWGSVGSYGGDQARYFHKREDAIADFKKIFKTNTGNDWENMKRFQTKPNKYTLIDFKPWRYKRNKELPDFQFDLTSPVPSELPEEIQYVLLEWTKPEALKEALKETNIDTSIVNFSNLSNYRDVLQKASDVLDKISELIEKKNLEVQQRLLDRKKHLNYAKELYNLSNHYLHDLIPYKDFTHDAVKPIDSLKELDNHRKKLFDLMDLEMIDRILMGAMYRKQDMNPLDYIYRAVDCKLKLMDKDDIETRHILQYILHGSGNDKFEVQAVFRVSRDSEDEQLQSCHLDNHKLLWHRCNTANLLSTMKQGVPVCLRDRVPGLLSLREGIFTTPSFREAVSDGRMFGQKNSNFVFLLEVALGSTAVDPNKLWKERFNSAYWSGYTRINDNRELLLPTGASLPVGRLIPVPLHRKRSWFSWYLVSSKEQACLRYLVQVNKSKK